MATAGDIINGSLRLIGQLAEGEIPSSETSADALTAMNQMLDSWSTERLAVYTTQDQNFTWAAAAATKTIGPTGNFVGIRPIQILDSSYFIDSASGVSYGFDLVNEQQYNGIALKTATTTYPQVMYVDNTNPDVTMTFYPVPSTSLDVHIISVLELAQSALLSTTLAFPPGYLRAFRYNLACELAAEFGVEPSNTVQRIAMVAKRDIKRVNNPGDILAMPAALAGGPPRYNIFAGNF